ncbi:hypothetical protein [Arthrobacter woluwensis]|uniref:hypothetical protein n=1 Tax=Arthrobacter woluwensis TaxID=156980 RepID=UPI0038266122
MTHLHERDLALVAGFFRARPSDDVAWPMLPDTCDELAPSADLGGEADQLVAEGDG